jgi:hypothetical protein
MTTTDHLDRSTQPKLTKLAARTVLAAGLGMAVMGLTAALANADPVPTPTRPYPTAPQNPHSESGLCSDDIPHPPPPPGYCG